MNYLNVYSLQFIWCSTSLKDKTYNVNNFKSKKKNFILYINYILICLFQYKANYHLWASSVQPATALMSQSWIIT